jgi:hypothetical protein
MIADALYTILSGFAGLTALVSTRIYPRRAPQEVTAPYVIFQRISTIRDHSHSGPSGLANPRYQFDAYAATPEEADAISDQIRLALDGYTGTVTSGESPALFPDVWIQGIFAEDERDITFDDKAELHRTSSDFFIFHRESVPA